MRGSLKQRSKGSWSLILDLGREVDPATGSSKRKQKWITFRGTRKEAEKRLTDLVGKSDRGEFVEPSKVTVLAYLRDWLVRSVKPLRRPATYAMYRSVIEHHVAKAALAMLPLQRVRTLDLEAYYGGLALSPSTIGLHHAVFSRAFKMAARDRLIATNPAASVEHRPRVRRGARSDAARKCWSADEARRVVEAAAQMTAQVSAFIALALDSGARKSELAGLTWADVDLDAATVTISRQLDRAGRVPEFGPTKTGTTRTVALNSETVTRLRAHKVAQAALKMRNRTVYQDHGMLFAKEPEHLQAAGAELGQPIKTLSDATFVRVVKAAGVRPITFHGVRHTSATLLLQAGVPVHVVAQRLGHASPSMTLDVYAHALTSAWRGRGGAARSRAPR